MDAGCNLAVNLTTQLLEVDGLVDVHRRDDGNNNALKLYHDKTPLLLCLSRILDDLLVDSFRVLERNLAHESCSFPVAS